MREAERISALRKILGGQKIHDNIRAQIEKLLVFRELLGPIEKQERYLVEVYANPIPCASCGKRVGFYESIDAPETYRIGNGGDKHTCIHCNVPLLDVVPFMAAGVTWFWHVDHERQAAVSPPG